MRMLVESGRVVQECESKDQTQRDGHGGGSLVQIEGTGTDAGIGVRSRHAGVGEREVEF